ncbi:heavy-metal-associated domain-containing protein [Phyllobacterium bourgognense]|uniref:Heavy-metal-associated domain-containing protein n=1 Tax=Phyllobacterium bourgognense TaxID=314236 RepID=A0A368YDH7_9HYPH|nr:heavy-metal-associated domain-containing protein [Phyllobacterium bourgognense]
MMAASTKARFRVEGMDCASCACKIDTAVRRLPGIADVSVSVSAGTMTINHDGNPSPLSSTFWCLASGTEAKLEKDPEPKCSGLFPLLGLFGYGFGETRRARQPYRGAFCVSSACFPAPVICHFQLVGPL